MGTTHLVGMGQEKPPCREQGQTGTALSGSGPRPGCRRPRSDVSAAVCFPPSSIHAHSALTSGRQCQGWLCAVTNWFSPSSSRGSRCWDCEADARPGARHRWHELDHREADAACHCSQADLSHLPCQQGQSQGAPEVTEGHRGMRHCWDGGKGLCSTEMIP